MGLRKHLEWHGATQSGIEALEVPFQVKLTKMPLLYPRLIESQIWVKIIPKNNIFYVSTSNSSYSVIFINFDQVWPEVDSWGH